MMCLWLPGCVFLDSEEVYAAEDLTPAPPVDPDPWREPK